jgi:hypothetical protein
MTDLDDRADQLAAIAAELAVRVRDETPDANGAWLAAELPDPADWFRLAFILAAAIPDDRSWTALTAWSWATARPQQEPEPGLEPEPVAGQVRPTRSDLRPCGTMAAASRHRYYREPMCEACRDAYRAYDRERKQVGRSA